ncbi:hypothetical protein C9374_006198 [Naegleria lovaniensis]|uniref:Macro domain-containing protein n=1 Tax=Naegleria lovaniensis TaxID=51637 RepID=A0AA88KHI3_NAELO|nr:uncharacterized protein C9374_006198 [Naegleria lovaniensis]KAG2381814.1 hypothetical protein C9374_006198 [Naegleria lovaniensis]
MLSGGVDEESKQHSNQARTDHSDELKQLNQSSLERLQNSLKSSGELEYHFKIIINNTNEKAHTIQLQLLKGSIVDLPFRVDAIVNAANESLTGGGGIDQLIHSKAGPGLAKECIERYSGSLSAEYPTLRCSTGHAVITHSHQLSTNNEHNGCDYIIHTVGPYLDEQGHPQPKLLKSCYEKSLDLMRQYGLKSIAFPCISTGFYGYPMEEACHLALDTCVQWLKDHKEHMLALERIVFVVYNDTEFEIYKIIFQQKFSATVQKNL